MLIYFLLRVCSAILHSVNLVQHIYCRIHDDGKLVHNTLTKREKESKFDMDLHCNLTLKCLHCNNLSSYFKCLLYALPFVIFYKLDFGRPKRTVFVMFNTNQGTTQQLWPSTNQFDYYHRTSMLSFLCSTMLNGYVSSLLWVAPELLQVKMNAHCQGERNYTQCTGNP